MENQNEHISGPAEYIKKLKAKYPRQVPPKQGYLPNELHQILSKTGLSAEEMTKSIQDIDYGEKLLDNLRGRLSDDILSLFDIGYVAIGEIGLQTPNAYTEEVDGNGFAIIFHTGLSTFIYRVIRAFSTRFNKNTVKDEKESISFEETCQNIYDIFWWYKNTEQATGPSYPITEFQLMLANQLAIEAECFFVAHEISHVLINSSKNRKSNMLPQGSSKWDEEYYSDQFAISTLLTRQNEKTSQVTLELSYAGAIVALEIFRSLESVGLKFEETHPPASDRLLNLKEYIRKRCQITGDYEQLSNLGSLIELVFKHVVDTINNPGKHQSELFDRAANELIQELDSLLEECTGGPCPDYVTFHSKATSLFNRGYSYKLLERVANISYEFFQVAKLNQPNHEQQNWILFQKYKLFISFIEIMTEPAKNIFQTQLGIN